MTPSFLTSKAIVRGDEENWRVKADNLVAAAFLLAVDKNILVHKFLIKLQGISIFVQLKYKRIETIGRKKAAEACMLCLGFGGDGSFPHFVASTRLP